MKKFFYNLSLIVFITSISCGSGTTSQEYASGGEVSKEFKDYWYAGEAEITSYKLEQARYGEIHEGDAVLIFVTEDFSKSNQVKLDNPDQNPKDKVPILKLNLTKKFNTGVYPYSLMQSVFTPVDFEKYEHSLKVSTTSQEWCGHTFTQLNLSGNQYKVHGFSYFESEGDIEKKIPVALLEDEIWNRIRLSPNDLPKGELKMIPGTLFSRLGHKPLAVENAVATLETSGTQQVYSIQYPELNRRLSVIFNKEFPHEITSWEETRSSGFGANRKQLTTKATLHKSMKLDYWNKHDVKDLPLRAELGLGK